MPFGGYNRTKSDFGGLLPPKPPNFPLSIFGDSLPYQPATGQPALHRRHSVQTSVKLETGKRSFSFASPFLWSILPNEMRQPSDDGLSGCLALARGPFHKRLKTHLFLKSYPT